jgi:TPR repeat protein
MARVRIVEALAASADRSAASDAPEPVDPMPLPTLDERANFYLQAVYGERRFTSQEYSEARSLILRTMADDIAARSNSRSPEDAPPLSVNHEGLAAFTDASLLSEGLERPRSAAERGFRDHQAAEWPVVGSRAGAPVVARVRHAISQWRRLPLFPVGHVPRRITAVCAAAAVTAVAGYWVAGIAASWFAPNTPPHDLTAEASPPNPSSGPPSGSNPSVLAEAQRELESALNAVRPDEIAALVKRGQELIAEGKFRLARMVLEQAADARSASAAFALGGTYDPLLARPSVRPDAPPDMAMARAWYERAKGLGSTEAARRLAQLPAPSPK